MSKPEKEVSCWSSKRIIGILWNFAVICVLLDFTCGGLLDSVDYLKDNRFKPQSTGYRNLFTSTIITFLCNYRVNTSITFASKEPEAKSFGSGFIISNNGYVLTCYHVITDSQVIKVRFDDNLLSAKVVYKDLNNDLALLKISGMFPALAFSTKPTAKMGQEVFAIGYPNPILQGVNEKLSRGLIISMTGVQDDIRLYQINIPIQPGNSGGPLLDMHGNVIGIVLAMSARTSFKEWGSSLLQNVNFAINSTYAKALLDTLPEAPY